MIRKARYAMGMGVIVWTWAGLFAFGQQVPELKPAVLKFELNLGKLGDLKVVKSLLENSPAMQGPDGEILRSAAVVSGLVSAPPDLGSIAGIGPRDPLPFDFVIRIEFSDAAGAEKLLEQTKSEREEVTEFGKTWFKPTEAAIAPENLRILRVDPKTVEFGTVGFLARSRSELPSPAVTKAWDQLGSQTLRVVGDFATAKAFVDQVVATLKEQTPPEARAFLAPIDKIAQIQLAADGSQGDLLSLLITGVDASGASDIHDGLEALLGLARMAAEAQVEQLQTASPAMAQAAGEILESLNSQLDGTTVKLVIPRPMGLDSALEEAIKSARAEAGVINSKNRLRQVALAIHNYHEAYGKFPFADQKGLSWRVAVLPFLEEDTSFREFDQNAAWDAAKNRAAAKTMPKIFGNGEGTSDIVYVVPAQPVQRFSEITDGTSNTIMMVQVPSSIEWAKPADLSPADVVELFKKLPDGGEIVAAFYDGSVRALKKEIDVETLKRLLDPTDGKTVELDE